MYKKYILVPLFVILVLGIIFTYNKDNLSPVFYELDKEYNSYLIDVSKENINTKNIMNYFDNIEILEVYPYINPIYKKIINISKYQFNKSLSNKKNISNLISTYLYLLEENNLKEEMTKYSINGIRINKIRLIVEKDILKDLIKKYNFRVIH